MLQPSLLESDKENNAKDKKICYGQHDTGTYSLTWLQELSFSGYLIRAYLL